MFFFGYVTLFLICFVSSLVRENRSLRTTIDTYIQIKDSTPKEDLYDSSVKEDDEDGEFLL